MFKRNRENGGKPPLDAETVLVNVGAPQIRIFSVESEQPAGRRAGTLPAEIGYERHGLIVPDRPWELSGLRDICSLGRGQSVWRVQSHVSRDIVEDLVVPNAESKTNYCVIVAEQRGGKSRRISHAQNRSKVILIGSHAGIAQCERSLGENERSDSTLGRIDL